MKNGDCVEFLQWALPRLAMRWPGFRNVRGQVCKRLRRRMNELGIVTFADYRDRLMADAAEWQMLDGFCRITISRFYRDKRVFDALGGTVLPERAAAARETGRSVRIWSAGCASGEETYSLAVVWDRRIRQHFPEVGRDIIGTDADPAALARAVAGCYDGSSVKDLPETWRTGALERRNGLYCVPPALRRGISFVEQDIRRQMPEGPFDIVLCRNLAFTYFDAGLQHEIVSRFDGRLEPSGYLVIGTHEPLPPGSIGFVPIPECHEILRRTVPSAGLC